MHILLLLTFFIYTCNAIIFHSYHRDSSSARERKEILQRTERHIMRSIPELLDLASGPIAEWEPELRNGFLVAFRPEHVPAWRRQMRDILALSTRTDLVVNIIPADSDQIVWGDDISGVTHMLFTDNYSKQMIMVPKPGHLKGMNYAMTGQSNMMGAGGVVYDTSKQVVIIMEPNSIQKPRGSTWDYRLFDDIKADGFKRAYSTLHLDCVLVPRS